MNMSWPELPLDAWRDTRETLHRYSQIVGKVQLALTPRVNHFWNVTLRITARGLATTALRYGDRTFDIELDLVDHRVVIRTTEGELEERQLRPMTVADFYRELTGMLGDLGIQVHVWDHPVELRSELIPFSEDHVHRAYDRDWARRFFHVLGHAGDVLEEFRARFIGKCSGVGFYWGTFDIAVARYCGRRVTAPTGNIIEREGYSHELSEAGFWPGDATYGQPAFYAMHYPQPDGYARGAVRPAAASWLASGGCWVLP
jgi:hypothetical protein